MRTKKVYIPIVLGLVLLAIGYLALRSDMPEEPIVISKATTPLPKQMDLRDTPPSTPTPDVRADSTPITDTETSEDITPIDVFQPIFSETDCTENINESEVSEDQTDYGVSPFGYGKYSSIPADYP